MMGEEFWKFETPNFRVCFEALEERDLDLSFDESGEIAEGLESGHYVAFVAHCTVTHKATGATLGESYLGGCVYESLEDFRDHIGINCLSKAYSKKEGRDVRIGSYFSDMVRESVKEARQALNALKRDSAGIRYA